MRPEDCADAMRGTDEQRGNARSEHVVVFGSGEVAGIKGETTGNGRRNKEITIYCPSNVARHKNVTNSVNLDVEESQNLHDNKITHSVE